MTTYCLALKDQQGLERSLNITAGSYLTAQLEAITFLPRVQIDKMWLGHG